MAKAQATAQILSKQNELRRVRAELEGEAQAIEREAEAAAKTARAQAEQELQRVRATLEQKRLLADVVIPAEVDQQAKVTLALGDAAPTQENGAAQVEVLRLLGEAWKSMGDEAREIYVIQHLEEIIETVVENLRNVAVEEVNVLDQGDGTGLSTYAATFPNMVADVLKALANSTGVDVTSVLRGPSDGSLNGAGQSSKRSGGETPAPAGGA